MSNNYKSYKYSDEDNFCLNQLQAKVDVIQKWLNRNINHPEFQNKVREQSLYLFKIAKIRKSYEKPTTPIYESNIIIHPIKKV
ncbi:MAG: hypothetical protein PHY08_12175 [Candidatus Cloacimonetes bacterium]|nr:hypothetical protein [Candidatus Cloacimonadota bacterium]